MSLPPVKTRERLSEVRYEIRGELARRARELEAQGRKLIKLNIGNPGAFGFRAPEHLQRAIAERHRPHRSLHPPAGPAGRARGDRRVPPARAARPTRSPERVFVGNGVSELIDLSLRALLNPGDEVLLPSPDYPLWIAATILNDGRPVYYHCTPENGFLPDPDEIEALVSPRTRAIVLINPNNPTGAAYPRELLEQHRRRSPRSHSLLLMCDEIYDSILYDDATFEPVAPLAGDLPCLIVRRPVEGASRLRLARRLGGAVGDPLRQRRLPPRDGPARRAAPVRQRAGAVRDRGGAARRRTPSRALCAPGGRLYEARRAVIEACAASEHLELVAPAGALYAFPAVIGDAAIGFDDHAFALELLETEGRAGGAGLAASTCPTATISA